MSKIKPIFAGAAAVTRAQIKAEHGELTSAVPLRISPDPGPGREGG